MQLVDSVVHALDLAHELAVIGQQRCHALAQHRFDDVAHMQRLARGAGERYRRRLHRRGIEIGGGRRVGALGLSR